jgi:hypothetical protein
MGMDGSPKDMKMLLRLAIDLLHYDKAFKDCELTSNEDGLVYTATKLDTTRAVFLRCLIHLNPKLDINTQDIEDKTLMHYACELGDYELVQTLMNRGGLVDNDWDRNGYYIHMRDCSDYPPAHYAVKSGNLKLIKFLLSKGLDLHTKVTFQKKTLASHLRKELLEPVLQFLLRECVIERLSNVMTSVIAILYTEKVSLEFLERELEFLERDMPHVDPESCTQLKSVILRESIMMLRERIMTDRINVVGEILAPILERRRIRMVQLANS